MVFKNVNTVLTIMAIAAPVQAGALQLSFRSNQDESKLLAGVFSEALNVDDSSDVNEIERRLDRKREHRMYRRATEDWKDSTVEQCKPEFTYRTTKKGSDVYGLSGCKSSVAMDLVSSAGDGATPSLVTVKAKYTLRPKTVWQEFLPQNGTKDEAVQLQKEYAEKLEGLDEDESLQFHNEFDAQPWNPESYQQMLLEEFERSNNSGWANVDLCNKQSLRIWRSEVVNKKTLKTISEVKLEQVGDQKFWVKDRESKMEFLQTPNMSNSWNLLLLLAHMCVTPEVTQRVSLKPAAIAKLWEAFKSDQTMVTIQFGDNIFIEVSNWDKLLASPEIRDGEVSSVTE